MAWQRFCDFIFVLLLINNINIIVRYIYNITEFAELLNL